MKRMFLLIILVSLSNIMMAQQYYPFPTQDAIWREFQVRVYGSSNTEHFNYQNFISGDTMISGKTCHKIYKTGYNDGYNYEGDFLYDYENVYVGAIREDSSKRVYLCGSPERLLYDFNLQVGDTLPRVDFDSVHGMYGTYFSDYFYTVGEVDSVLVAGNYHKRFKISYHEGQCVFYLIEGIGASTGLISWYLGSCSWGYQSELICFMQDSINAYPDGQECELIYLGVDEPKTKQHIEIFPNPGPGVINLSGLPDNPLTIQAFNLFGQKVYETSYVRGVSKIDLSRLPKGMFLLKVWMNGEPVKTEKIVLQ